MATLKQKKLVTKIVENCGNVSKSMREVGYSPNSAKNPKHITGSEGFKEEAESFVKQMQKERTALIKEAKKKRDSANYSDIVRGIDILPEETQIEAL